VKQMIELAAILTGTDTLEFVTMAAIRFILPAPSTWS
jgi:hypothetical protein